MKKQICIDLPENHEYYLVVGKRKIELGFRWITSREWMIIKDSSEYRDLGYRYRGYIIIKYNRYKKIQNQIGVMQHLYYIKEWG